LFTGHPQPKESRLKRRSPIAHHARLRLVPAEVGRTSAPRLPQVLQTKRVSISESLISSGHRSAISAIEWLQL